MSHVIREPGASVLVSIDRLPVEMPTKAAVSREFRISTLESSSLSSCHPDEFARQPAKINPWADLFHMRVG